MPRIELPSRASSVGRAKVGSAWRAAGAGDSAVLLTAGVPGALSGFAAPLFFLTAFFFDVFLAAFLAVAFFSAAFTLCSLCVCSTFCSPVVVSLAISAFSRNVFAPERAVTGDNGSTIPSR